MPSPLAADADLDLVLETLYAPMFQRWLLRSGPLTADYADALVDATLSAFRPWTPRPAVGQPRVGPNRNAGCEPCAFARTVKPPRMPSTSAQASAAGTVSAPNGVSAPTR